MASTAASKLFPALHTAFSLAAIICVSTVVPTASVILVWVLRPCRILQLHFLHNCLHFLYLSGQLLLVIFHPVGHIIGWCFNYRRILHQESSCYRNSCNPATTSRTMFLWCIPESSAVRSEVSRSSWCAVQKNCLNLTHVPWTVVMIFHLWIANPDFPVLWRMA